MQVVVNTKTRKTQGDLDTLMQAVGVSRDECVIFRNGYACAENCALQEGDEILYMRKGEMPEEAVYARMLALRNTPALQKKLQSSRVGIAGLGGLGSSVALALARSGVGTLHLVDFDCVDFTNLNRQQYSIRHLGMPKTQALREIIQQVNPYVRVETDCVKIDAANCASIFRQDDIVCEALDRAEAKSMLVSRLLESSEKRIVVAASGMAGMGKANDITTRQVFRRLYVCGDMQSDSEHGMSLMAPRVAICAGHQAQAILRLIAGESVV